MKKYLILAVLAIVPAITVSAQYFNPDSFRNDFEASVGFQSDFRSGEGPGARIDVSYARFYRHRIGFRVGACYMPDNVGISHSAGIPVAFAWRTRIWGYEDQYVEASKTAIGSSIEDFAEDIGRYDYYYDDDSFGRDIAEGATTGFLTFLANLVSRFELYCGLTPGYIFGDDSTQIVPYPSGRDRYYETGIVTPHDFYLSADLGARIVIRIWRLSFNISPAAHYYITDNFREYNSAMKTKLSDPIRWQMSLNFGISCMF